MNLNRSYLITATVVLASASIMAFVGCGEIKNSGNSFAYQYIVGTCDTKRHAFTDKLSYCKGLQNHSANNNCAYDERRAAFENASCGASFEQPVN